MDNDILLKIARIITIYKTLSKSKDLTEFDEALLLRLREVVDIFSSLSNLFDEVLEIHDQQYVVVQEEAHEPVRSRSSIDNNSVALGVGLGMGGVFDYLRSPQNVENSTGSERVRCISEEELFALEDCLDL